MQQRFLVLVPQFVVFRVCGYEQPQQGQVGLGSKGVVADILKERIPILTKPVQACSFAKQRFYQLLTSVKHVVELPYEEFSHDTCVTR